MLANSLILNSNYDVVLNYNINDLYLIINEDFIEVRDNLTSTSKILYTKIYTNHSINLNVAVSNLTKQNHQLFLYPNESYPLNFQANITNINPNDSKLEISFLSETSKSKNIKNFNFHVNNNDFLTISNIQPNHNIKVISSNTNQLLAQILPYSQRSNLIICYNGYECPKYNNFSIHPEENYISSVNDDNIIQILNEFFSISNLQKQTQQQHKTQYQLQHLSLFFANEESPNIDFSFIPFDHIQNIDIIGHSQENPQNIILTNQDKFKLVKTFRTSNVKFLKEKASSDMHLQSHQDRKTSNALIKTISDGNCVIFPVNYDFTSSQNIIFTIGKEYVELNDTLEVIFSQQYYPKKENIFLFKNVNEVYDNITINIVPLDDFSRVIFSEISFRFERCPKISIVFSGWEGRSKPEIMFNFYSETRNALDIIPSKNKIIKYTHYNLDDELFYEYPSAFVFCMKNAPCNEEEFEDLYPFKYDCASTDQNIMTCIKEPFDNITLKSLSNLIICMGKDSPVIDFDFAFLTGEKSLNITFKNYAEDRKTFKINGFPSRTVNKFAIINCSIEVKPANCVINELTSINSIIKGVNLNIVHGTFFKNVNFDSDINFVLDRSNYYFEENDYKYKETDVVILKLLTTSNSNQKVNFNKNDASPCGVNLQFDEVVADENFGIPILFGDSWKNNIQRDYICHIRINVSSHENFTISSFPKEIDLNVFNLDWNQPIHRIPAYATQSNVVICYESFKCASKEDFSIDNSTLFISTKDKGNYDEIIEIIKGYDKSYEYLRMIFIDKGEVINFPINNIPSKFYQMQLYGYGNAKILLEDGADISKFGRWMTNHVSFARNDNIDYHFEELIINGTDPVFQDVLYYSNKIQIDKAIFNCKSGYSTFGLENVDLNGDVFYELFPNSDTDNYVLSLRGFFYYGNSNTENGNGDPSIRPESMNSNFIFYVPKPNYKFTICRFDNIESKISVKLQDVQENFHIEYMCKSNECNKHFIFNFNIPNDDISVPIDEGNCINTTTTINEKPTSTPSMSPLQTPTPHFSLSSHFTLSSQFSPSGYFACSLQFSDSAKFSKSFPFTRSTRFSKSSIFSETDPFSLSSKFIDSDQFSLSNFFTNSHPFTMSSFFSGTISFSATSAFTKTSVFSISSSFSPSIFQSTSAFTGSQFFSKTPYFTLSSTFTQSIQFTPSFPLQSGQLPSDDIPSCKSGSAMFNITANGLYGNQNGNCIFNNDDSSINIVFSAKNIIISELNEFLLPKMMYFEAEKPGSRITIDESLKNSEVGVKAENSPTVVLKNPENSLNIKNYKHGYSTMDIEYDNGDNKDEDIELILREVNNSNGYLTLNVDREIRSICFTSLFMARISSLRLKYKEQDENENENQRTNVDLLEEDNDEEEGSAQIIVNNYINISSESNVILTKVELRGNLNIYDDSLLTFKEETIFDEKSNINIFFQSSKDPRQQPILRFEGLLDSTPDKIIITFDDKTKSTKFKEYVMIEGRNFKTCLSWIDKLEFVNNKRTIETKCEYIEGGLTHFVLSTKKSKLSAGAIAGIVIGCVVVIAIIIAIIVIIVRHKKYEKSVHEALKNTDTVP